MNDRSKEIHDMIQESPLVDPRVLNILSAMNRRMDEIEASMSQSLLELKAYREGGVTEEILRRNDGYIKVGRGCVIALDVTPPPVSVESRTIKPS